MKIVTIIGARPQFIKAAPLSIEIRKSFKEIIIHTGQHYDQSMSEIFFQELEISYPDYNLEVNQGNHGQQTGKMLIGIEEILVKEKPDIVLVYGDTNSTLAGALAASKLHIPIAHIEAGLRSFNRKMPEEINRILTDHISKYLFVPSKQSIKNLNNEGIDKGIFEVGDIMYDSVLLFKEKAKVKSSILSKLNLTNKDFHLLTIHRAENTSSPNNIQGIFDAISEIETLVIFPIHPRTKKFLSETNIKTPKNIISIDPLGYLDMLQLMEHSTYVLTDSGGMQKEAYYFKKPCITLRDETEWIETLAKGWNVLCGSNKDNILTGYEKLSHCRDEDYLVLYGDGKTSEKIGSILRRENREP